MLIYNNLKYFNFLIISLRASKFTKYVFFYLFYLRGEKTELSKNVKLTTEMIKFFMPVKIGRFD